MLATVCAVHSLHNLVDISTYFFNRECNLDSKSFQDQNHHNIEQGDQSVKCIKKYLDDVSNLVNERKHDACACVDFESVRHMFTFFFVSPFISNYNSTILEQNC